MVDYQPANYASVVVFDFKSFELKNSLIGSTGCLGFIGKGTFFRGEPALSGNS